MPILLATQLHPNQNRESIHLAREKNRYLYDIEKPGKAPREIKDVAVMPEFYEQYGQGDQQEKRFGRLESEAAKVVRHLIDKETDKRIKPKPRKTFSEFLATLHYRTLKQRLFLERETRVFLRAVVNDPGSESERDYFDSVYNTMKSRYDGEMLFLDKSHTEAQKHSEPQRSSAIEKINARRKELTRGWEGFESVENDFKNVMADKEKRERFTELSNDLRSRHLDIINQRNESLTQIIDHAKWTVVPNRSILPTPFVTTDSPIVIYPLGEPGSENPLIHQNIGLCRLGLVDFLDNQGNYPPYVLYFPLNPKLMLSIAPTLPHDVVFDHVEVFRFQYFQYMQAHDEIYSHKNEGFMLAEKAFAEEKEIRAALGLQFRRDWT